MDRAQLLIEWQTKGVNEADASMRRATQAAQSAGTNVNKLSTATSRASATMQAFGQKMIGVGQPLTRTGRYLSLRITAPLIAIGAQALRTAANFEQSMNRVRALTGATGSTFEQLEATARQLGATTQFSASEAAEGMGFLAMAGFEANEIISAMPATLNLAAAGVMSLGDTADIVSNIMQGFGITAEDLEATADILTQTFTSSNTNLQQLGYGMSYVAPVAKENLTAFVEQIDSYSDNALAAGCKQGIVTTGPAVGGRSYQEQRKALVEALAAAGEKVASKGFKLNLEPLNLEVNHAGYFLKCPKESVAIAANFLKQKGIDEKTINLISECIMATSFPQKPTNKISEALCDADMMHLGEEYYFEFAEKLRQELKAAGIKSFKKAEFEKESVQFFKAHTFYTGYCKREINSMKEKNLKRIQESISKRKLKTQIETEQDKRYSRGVDSMFKLTARNQISLSAIADNKSNILISLNGIIISFGLVAIASKFKEEPAIIVPSVIFILFSLSTIILAILSTRPNISSGEFSRDDIKQGKVNMLFFGNFYKMKLEEYERAIKEMIDNDQYLYATMAKDQYFLGKVLARKYKLLRWAYNLFMVGIVVSVIAFLLVFMQL